MTEPTPVASFDSRAGALRALAAIGRAGIAASLEESDEGAWTVVVERDDAPGAVAALAVTPSGSSEEIDLSALIRARSSNSSSVGILWVSLGVSAIVIVALGGSFLDGFGRALLVGAVLVTLVLVLAQRSGR